MIRDDLNIKVFGGNLRSAIQIFCRRTQQSGLIGEVKRHNAFIPTNEKARLKAWRAQSRQNRHKRRAEVKGR